MFNTIKSFFTPKKNPVERYDLNSAEKRHHFAATLRTLKANKVMVMTKEDGIYVRLAGNPSKGEAFSYVFGKVINFPISKENKP